jgi:hypothetical protein
MSDTARDERLQIMLTDEELRALDDWRFAQRMPSRAAAVRELLRRGLATDGYDISAEGRRSQDFGVMGGAAHTQPQHDVNPPKPDGKSS